MSRLILAVLPALLLATSISHAGSSPAERLGEAVRFKTVSYQDRSQIDYGEFGRFHEFLRATYPRVFGELDVEVINDSQNRLSTTWPLES